ncbi:hypothetical protein [Azotobacter beijerinckii]|uniref:hypothetical protein n=1 Tax=Azotobacter beijerinckii TaxID=170623 RepID=UPI0029548C48|nr:hypothetical protein [Azotobacter beijerinckii]MDV7213567.1 hypothetical protein [Azotobacter beijerinckii]
MRCALCFKESSLRKSHIIPEFLYKALYDDKHRFHVLSTLPAQENWKEQKGLRENLLCDVCEQRISIWERYACMVLKGGVKLTYAREGNVVHVSGLDYAKFKLFQMSVLWRAGVSSLQFFEKVQLGKHSEILRRMLLDGDPGPPERYGCFMFGLKHEAKAFTGVIVQPGKSRLYGHNGYKFVFGGFLWAILTSSHDLRPPLRGCTLRATGDTVILMRNAAEIPSLIEFSKKLENMGRAP